MSIPSTDTLTVPVADLAPQAPFEVGQAVQHTRDGRVDYDPLGTVTFVEYVGSHWSVGVSYGDGGMGMGPAEVWLPVEVAHCLDCGKPLMADPWADDPSARWSFDCPTADCGGPITEATIMLEPDERATFPTVPDLGGLRVLATYRTAVQA